MKFWEFNPQRETPSEQVFRTYQNLRVGLCAIGALLPLMVWGADLIELGRWWPRDSISAYYHSEHSLTRDVFVGNLFVVGIFLMLYRGYSGQENIALDVAGFLLTLVAIFPISPESVPDVGQRTLIERLAYCELSIGRVSLTIHGVSAVGFFLAIAYVAIFLSKETLDEQSPATSKYLAIYRTLGILMIAAPIGAFLFVQLIGKSFGVFVVETAGILVFAVYWAVKTREFWGTQGAIEARILGCKA